jgi:EAL domain-containing protein (putative c-di-GMP-specific phosphodiesterase class I)
VPLHLNVADAELGLPNFPEAVLTDLDEAGVDPEAIVLEVRERHLADPALREVVTRLSQAGIAVLVENAGQGGLSLPDLAGMSVQGLKLGQSLVARIREDDPLAVEVARSLVLLAHGLGWRSLAVGVETDHQRSVLFGFGVDAVQGKVAAMPMDHGALLDWLAGHHAS